MACFQSGIGVATACTWATNLDGGFPAQRCRYEWREHVALLRGEDTQENEGDGVDEQGGQERQRAAVGGHGPGRGPHRQPGQGGPAQGLHPPQRAEVAAQVRSASSNSPPTRIQAEAT